MPSLQALQQKANPMKTTKLRRPYPSEIAAVRRESRKWFPLLLVAAILASVVFVGCDAVATQTSDGDSTRVHIDTTIPTPKPGSHVFAFCAIGEDPEPTCESCIQDQFEWDIDVAFSSDTIVRLPSDTVQCRTIGTLADTTRFEVLGVGRIGHMTDSWFLVDGDSIPFRWDGKVNADSLRATRWNESDN